MKSTKIAMTRRTFLESTAKAGIAASVLPAMAAGAKSGGAGKTRVVLIRDAEVLGKGGKINGAVLQKMLDTAMASLTKAPDAKAAWKTFISEKDIVGVKTNAWNSLPTPPELEKIIEKRLLECGVAKDGLSFDDRGVRGNPVFQKATKLINVRPMRTHHWSGVGGCLKNPIMFVESPYSYHDDFCAPLGQMWKDAGIVGKVRLNILVMLTPLFYGIGPHHYDTKYVWQYNGLIAGTDPVAVDRVGLEIIDRKRKAFFGKKTPFKPTAHHIQLADTRHGLGTADLKKIDLVKLGLKKGILLD